LRLDVIAVAVGVILVAALAAGIVNLGEAFLVAGAAVVVTWRVHREIRLWRKNPRK